jgi:hypothetical protein
MQFRYAEDVEEWLAPLTYEEVWRELSKVAPEALSRPLWDSYLRDGQNADDVLYVVKGMIRSWFVANWNLPPRWLWVS